MDTPVNPDGKNDQTEPVMEQDEPGHAKQSSEQIPNHYDPEGRAHETAPEQEHSPGDDAFIIPDEQVE